MAIFKAEAEGDTVYIEANDLGITYLIPVTLSLEASRQNHALRALGEANMDSFLGSAKTFLMQQKKRWKYIGGAGLLLGLLGLANSLIYQQAYGPCFDDCGSPVQVVTFKVLIAVEIALAIAYLMLGVVHVCLLHRKHRRVLK